MPNVKAKSLNTAAVGVDGCPDGWLAAFRTNTSPEINWTFFASWLELVQHFKPRPICLAVDMPIGLIECGRRLCDVEARERLTRSSVSSIFSPPRRPMLDFTTYEEANEWGRTQGPREKCGGGLSKQSWNLREKIKEIDAWINPRDQAWIIEAHPELAFDQSIDCNELSIERLPGKKTLKGQVIRARILSEVGVIIPPMAAFPIKSGNAQMDDFLDAAILLHVAERKQKGEAICLPRTPQHDCRRLRMEIWY